MKYSFYDFDGTIYDGDSTLDFIKYCIKIKKSTIIYLPKILLYSIKYKLKFITKEKMKESFFEILVKFDNIDETIDNFWKSHDNKIKCFFKDKNSHKLDIIASASPKFLLEPIAKKYKIHDLFASPVNKNTGKYEGKNCRDVEKLRLINIKYPKIIINEMYSDDAKADKPLLDLANHSYIVKKNEIIDYHEYLNLNSNILKAFWNKICNIYNKNKELLNYLIVGGLTTLISVIVYYSCVRTILNPNNSIELQIANIISWIIAVLFAYYTNRKYVFNSKNKQIKKEFSSFVGSRIFTLLLDMLTMFIFVTVLNIYDLIGKLVAQLLVIIGNYVISKYIVFKGRDKK